MVGMIMNIAPKRRHTTPRIYKELVLNELSPYLQKAFKARCKAEGYSMKSIIVAFVEHYAELGNKEGYRIQPDKRLNNGKQKAEKYDPETDRYRHLVK